MRWRCLRELPEEKSEVDIFRNSRLKTLQPTGLLMSMSSKSFGNSCRLTSMLVPLVSASFTHSPSIESSVLQLIGELDSDETSERGRRGRVITHCTTDIFLASTEIWVTELVVWSRGQPGLCLVKSSAGREIELKEHLFCLPIGLITSSLELMFPSLASKLNLLISDISDSPNSE